MDQPDLAEIAARTVHEVIRAYQIATLVPPETTVYRPWDEAPEWQKTAARLGVKQIRHQGGASDRDGSHARLMAAVVSGILGD